MRKFKFRAWLEDQKCMKDFDFSEIALSGTLGYQTGLYFNHQFVPFNSSIMRIMQYLGDYFIDRNGKELCEGDIVSDCRSSDIKFCCLYEIFYHPAPSTYSEPKFAFRFSNHSRITGYIPDITDKNLIKFEIIGNIYENNKIFEE